jgi:hypothetical protein
MVEWSAYADQRRNRESDHRAEFVRMMIDEEEAEGGQYV